MTEAVLSAETPASRSPRFEPALAEPPYDFRLGLAFGLTSLLVGLAQGLGLYLVSSNLASIQGSIGATATEAGWLTTAYFATALSSSLLLVKARLQFGLRPFASFGLLCYIAIASLHLLTNSTGSAIAARAVLGLAAAPLSALAPLYMVEAFPKRLAPIGLVLGFMPAQLGLPLARVVPTALLEAGQWHGLFTIDVALAVLSFAAIHAVSLKPVPLLRSFCPGDLFAFPLYAVGLALLCVTLSQGTPYWWTDTQWLGVCLACAIACIALYVVVDLRRGSPLVDLRWLATPYTVRFVIAVLLFRIVLSEQNIAVVGLMTALGQSNEQMQTLFALATAGMLAGFLIAIAIFAPSRVRVLPVLAALLVMIAAWSDSYATSLTRPAELYVTQTLLAAGLAVFFAAAALLGFGPVVADGSRNLVSFLAAFTASQYLGSLLGIAWINTAVIERQHWHYAALVQHLSLSDPLVATRVAQLTRSLAPVVTDTAVRGQRGLAALAQQVTRESLVLAYNDVFLYITVIAGAIFVWLTWRAWSVWRATPDPSAPRRPDATASPTTAA